MTTRSLRKERIGVVSSDKMEKSVVVSEVKKVKHPVYGKFVLKTKKSQNHFIKLMSDDYLESELTNIQYDSLAKDKLA